MSGNIEYTELPVRARAAIDGLIRDEAQVTARVAHFVHVQARPADNDGDIETLDGVTFTHRFVDAPGDIEPIRWHYVETGKADAEVIVFLHGIPDSWFQWYRQMSALSSDYRCIAVDLKGYGQSDKTGGDYTHAGVAQQLYEMLRHIGVDRFNLVTHDRGTVQGDYIAATHPESVLRYGRGEQHLYHFHPDLAPQHDVFMKSLQTGVMENPTKFVSMIYMWAAELPISDNEMVRVIQEYSYPGIAHAVPRYFHSSTFRKEWLDRHHRLLAAWRCPVMIMQGYDSRTQPREFYENAREYIPNARDVKVRFIDGGHFWTLESPAQATEAIRDLLRM